ncbi:flagellar basal body P-ring formation chaperone FlgA [Persephonella sp.]
MKCSEQLEPSNLSKLFLVFLVLFHLASGKTVLQLKKEVTVEKSRVSLSDIAVIRSDSDSFADYLGNLTVRKGLKPGDSFTITKKQIENLLKKNYVNVSEILINGEKTVVRRKIIKLGPQEIEKRVRVFLKERYPDIKVDEVRFSYREKIFPAPYRLVLDERSKTSSYIYLTGRVISGGKIVDRINISVRYRQFADVVFAKRDILKGETITIEDVIVRKTEKKAGYITDIKSVIGARAKTNIPSGKPLKVSMVEPDYPVKKRSYVKVIYDRNGIKIEITGIALENGLKGQVIKVKNPSTGKVLSCRVLGKDTVLFIGGM